MIESDLSQMSAAELQARAEALIRQAQQQSTREFESTLNFLSDKLKTMGKTKRDAVVHLVKMMTSIEAEQTLAELNALAGRPAQRRSTRSDLDASGQPPEVGVTYMLPTGVVWTRKNKTGVTRKDFAEHAKTTTWVAMRV